MNILHYTDFGYTIHPDSSDLDNDNSQPTSTHVSKNNDKIKWREKQKNRRNDINVKTSSAIQLATQNVLYL